MMVFTLFLLYLLLPILTLHAQQPDTGASRGEQAARIPYVYPTPGTSTVADTIRARRGNGSLLALDGVLLNSETLATGWNAFGLAIRDHNTVPEDIRELLILRCAVLNSAAYEWIEHEPVARRAGLTTAQLLEIRLTPPFGSSMVQHTNLTPELSAALIFADWITKEVKVPQAVFDGLKGFLNDRQMVEAVATIGCYNMVSRVLVAFDVDGKADTQVPIPR